MAGEWETTLLRDLLVTTKDGDWGKENPEDGYLPYHIIRGTDFPDVRVGDLSSVPQRYLPEHTVKRRTLEADDILIETAGGTRDRPTGRTLLITEKVLSRFRGPATCASFARFLRIDRKQADPRFVFWYLQHLYDKGEMSQHQVQHTGVARFQYTRFAETQNVPLPPLAEQKAIAAVLGALDDKIELNRRMNATLEAMARALFQSWFVDFDPVRAKLDGRQPAGLDPATATLFPATFEEATVGSIPTGWRIGSIYEIADVIYGAPFASSLFNSEKRGTPLVRIRDLANESPAVFTTEAHPKGYLLQPGDIAVGMDGEFRAYLWAGVESWLNQRVCVFSPKPRYSAAFVRNSIFAPLAQVEATETATTVIHLGKNDIDRFTAIIPDAPVAEAFKRQCQPWYDQIVANKQQSRTLATLRDTLLPRLLSGDLRMSEPMDGRYG